MYVIKRLEQDGGGFVAPTGSAASYTPYLQRARTFATRAEAEREHCSGNECVVPVLECMLPPSTSYAREG